MRKIKPASTGLKILLGIFFTLVMAVIFFGISMIILLRNGLGPV